MWWWIKLIVEIILVTYSYQIIKIYKYIKIYKTNTMLYVNYISIFKETGYEWY